MVGIIRITFVVIAILSTVRAKWAKWLKGSKCDRPTIMSLDRVCGSDGKSYGNIQQLNKAIDCLKEKNNVTSVDLHLVHHWGCFIWEKYGIGTTWFILVKSNSNCSNFQ